MYRHELNTRSPEQHPWDLPSRGVLFISTIESPGLLPGGCCC